MTQFYALASTPPGQRHCRTTGTLCTHNLLSVVSAALSITVLSDCAPNVHWTHPSVPGDAENSFQFQLDSSQCRKYAEIVAEEAKSRANAGRDAAGYPSGASSSGVTVGTGGVALTSGDLLAPLKSWLVNWLTAPDVEEVVYGDCMQRRDWSKAPQ